ncbi:MAG: hypothetical protein GY711_26795 [bacterium]|nr:hypothetical protein [bacterium]
MRIAGTALPASLLLFTACTSTSSNNATSEAESSPSLPNEPAASAEPAVGGQDGQDLGQQAQRLSLKQQKQRFLVESYIEKARELKAELQLEQAAAQLSSALQIDADNLEAKQLYAEVTGLMGREAGQFTTVSQTMADEFRIRTEQLKSEAEDAYNKGRLAMSRGDYDSAIADFTLSLNYIKWAPYSLDWGGIDVQAQEQLERAKADRIAAQEAARLRSQQEAHAALQDRAVAERTRREAIVGNMLEQGIDAFQAAQYDKAMEFADQALRHEPRNTQAMELRDAAFRSGREKVRADYIIEKREEFAKWREHLQELEIPWTNVITLPDPDDWRRLTEMRQGRRGLDLSQTISASELALRTQLDTTPVALPKIEDEESLRTVVNYIRDFTGMPLVVDPAAEDAVLNEGITFNFTFDNELTVTQLLNHIASMAGEEVTWTIRHDAVLMTTKEKARGAPIIVNHDIQDLIMAMTDFTGPRIDRLRLLDELEDDDGGGPFGGILESPRLIEIEDLAALIQENVAVDTWDSEGVSIEPGEGFILITHSADVQQQVKDFLEDLRRFNSSLVTIESKFMTVGDNWIQEIGVDFRGLDGVDVVDVTNGLEDMASRGLDNGGAGSDGQDAAGPPSAGFFYDDGADGDFRGTTQNFFGDALGSALSSIGGLTFQLTFLDDMEVSAILRAVEKTSQFELVNNQMLSVHNTQRAYVMVINQQAYIQDFDVEVAQFQAVADPQINVLHEGVVLDVRPTIHHNRKYLTLEIQPTVAKVVALNNFSTTLGGNTSPVEFQLPELEVQSVNTSAILPDGGSILLGGLSSIRNIERRAEVPWLGRIPIVGFLFKSEGYNDERESLMILIKASITDVREAVKTKLETRY